MSEQITVTLPKVSAAGKLLTMAFFFAITVDPTAKAAIIAPAKPSGINATIIPIIARNM
ncbi:MAG: hypothetical protein APG11_01860 [Candidatus Methanofastidiosum methylothiophilum]|uniref:Uncharacterized protein n=1 Tax=Candidatus Methanofastidiosum methylothiophilum TaxID=1705564 RepID=A0A150ING4_9EURY|nr:MAG: hypothetical protein APG11_01860 [Candidatus Methanofastidiosum methylthiophilus]